MPVLKCEFHKKSFIMNGFLQNHILVPKSFSFTFIPSHAFLCTKNLGERPKNAEFKTNKKILKMVFQPLCYEFFRKM